MTPYLGHHITSDSDDSYSEYETDSEFIVTGFPDEENDAEGVQQECGSESSDDLEEVDGADQEHEVEDGEDDSDLGEGDGDLGEDESDLDEENNDLEEGAEQNSDSEDDAPESVSFESGKKNVLKVGLSTLSLCLCVYVCVCAYVCVYVCECVCVCMIMCVCVRVCVYICV